MALNFVQVFFTIFLCIHVALDFHQTSAQELFLRFFCSNDIGNYTQNSTFQTNLNTILNSVASNVNQYGFYNGTAGQAGTDQVNAIAYCRGDQDIDTCRDCISSAAYNLTSRTICPNQKEAVGWYEVCMFRYSNTPILQIMTIDPGYTLPNLVVASNLNLFTPELNRLADNLRNQAYNGTLRKFASGRSDNPNVQTIYGYMQCTPDITPGDCMFCLNSTQNSLPGNLEGARRETPSCSFRYEIYSFISPTPTPAVAPSSTSPPPPAPSSTSTGS